jgi:hypothetical protein
MFELSFETAPLSCKAGASLRPSTRPRLSKNYLQGRVNAVIGALSVRTRRSRVNVGRVLVPNDPTAWVASTGAKIWGLS